MAKLEYSESIGRLIRIDEPDGQLGRSTLLEAYDAIDSGDVPEAKRLLESFRLEQQIIQDIYVDWIWAMLTWVRRRVGEPEVETIMRETLGSWASPSSVNTSQHDTHGDQCQQRADNDPQPRSATTAESRFATAVVDARGPTVRAE